MFRFEIVNVFVFFCICRGPGKGPILAGSPEGPGPLQGPTRAQGNAQESAQGPAQGPGESPGERPSRAQGHCRVPLAPRGGPR